ncbi:hypothetical protein [Clostridium cuniculi]|uniref:hypothetical protein n=1 Tax=Clostridium cuniculi TaxID=2548455 RepID=UPI0018ABB686|nr:hypothetical protein [Clostridium cuniculi]
MQKYSELMLGLISGIVLTFLNNELVHGTLISVFTLFNPVNDSKVSLFLVQWSSILIIFLSFIGIIITITYLLLILKTILISKQS